MNQATPNKLKPALIGGIAEGVASSVPLRQCRLLPPGGGRWCPAAYFYTKDAPPSAQALGDGLKLGLLAGLIGAVVFALISIPLVLRHPEETLRARRDRQGRV